MVDSHIKKVRCPNILCLGIAEQCGHDEYWCKVCGSRWLIKELVITTNKKKKSGESGVPSRAYDPRHLYESQEARLRRNRY